MNVYVDLTNSFNNGRFRAILSSGQAVVLHRLAIMSKDGDWIVREDEEALNHILKTLDEVSAKYRFGAPLDKRWLAGGWSSHFEFNKEKLRVRTDFVSRPPRIDANRLIMMWKELENCCPPFVDLTDLAELKKTNREKDFVIIGELARRMGSVEEQLRYSRSAKDILEIYQKKSQMVLEILRQRGIESESLKSVDALEIALDAERRRLIHRNEAHLLKYIEASQEWSDQWKEIEKQVHGCTLLEAHQIITNRAEGVLPFTVPHTTTDD
ncbi:MAG: hypothetical protein JW795_05985 [Chitinivibrionales bacterium]|nr:hypothetical protein [Chitinivibrionales bacterium]